MLNGMTSTANLGQWNYYIFSDNSGMWSALNGLAAWFNGSSGIISSAALLGAMILLATALLSATTHNIKINASTIAIWFFFSISLGLKGTAVVTNVYTSQVTVIANVPALVLVPASTFSTVAWNVFQGMETAFQSTSGSYMSVQQNGFVGPLEILLALRSPSAPMDQYLKKTLVETLTYCETDAPGSTATNMLTDIDALNWLANNQAGQGGIVNRYTAQIPAGEYFTCGSNFVYLNAETESYAGSAAMAEMLNRATKVVNPQSSSGSWNSGSMNNAFNALLGSSSSVSQQSYQFAKNALIASTVKYTQECLASTLALKNPSVCEASASYNANALEMWKTNATMEAGGFLKTMFDSIGFLQVIFFGLFPVVALYALVVVQNTGKVFFGYIFFGIWIQSWMLVIAPIQAYIQNQVIDAIGKIVATSHGLTIANSSAIYNMLSTKLALAADTMASSQMLSLALLSGSLFSLNSIAQKWSGRDFADPTDAQPTLRKHAPLQNVKILEETEMLTGTGLNGNGILSIGGGPGRVGGTETYTFNNAINQQSGWSGTDGQSSTYSKQVGSSIKSSTGYEFSAQEESNLGQTNEDAREFTAGISAGVAKGIIQMFSKGRKLTELQASTAQKQIMAEEAKVAKKMAEHDATWLGRMNSEDLNVKTQAWQEFTGNVIDGLTLTAAGAEIAGGFFSGGATLAAVGGTVAMGAMVKEAVKHQVPNVINKVSQAAQAASIALDKGAGYIAAIGGDVKANAKASVKEAIKASDTYKTAKGSTSSGTWSANDEEGVNSALNSAKQNGGSQSASSGEANAFQMTMDKAALIKMAALGKGDINGEQWAKGVHAGLLQMMQSGKYTPDQIKRAKAGADMFLSGEHIQSMGGRSPSQIADTTSEMVMQKILGGSINLVDNLAPVNKSSEIFGPGSAGQITIPGKPAVEGHWVGPKGNAPKPGELPNHWIGNNPEAAAAGWRWIKGTPGTSPQTINRSELLLAAGNKQYDLARTGEAAIQMGNQAIAATLANAKTAAKALHERYQNEPGYQEMEEQAFINKGLVAVGFAVAIATQAAAGYTAGIAQATDTHADAEAAAKKKADEAAAKWKARQTGFKARK